MKQNPGRCCLCLRSQSEARGSPEKGTARLAGPAGSLKAYLSPLAARVPMRSIASSRIWLEGKANLEEKAATFLVLRRIKKRSRRRVEAKRGAVSRSRAFSASSSSPSSLPAHL
jgi:hypothetical protein